MIPTFSSIFDLLKAFPTEQTCIDHLENLRWNGNVVSPFDADSKVYKCAGNKYKCKSTGKYFNVKVGTIFEDTKIPLQKWFMALYVFSSHKKGISSHQLAKDISVTQKSAWFMLHRLRYAFEHPAFKEIMGNPVEIDETYIGGKLKNKHSAERRATFNATSPSNKTAVVGLLERSGNVQTHVVPDVRRTTVLPIIHDAVKKGLILYTDSSHLYTPLKSDYTHDSVNHERGEYVRGIVHTNSIEGFWSQMKRGIYGIYHHASPKHLQSYANEFSLRYNTRKDTTCNRFNLVLENCNGRLTYKNLIK